MRPPTSSLLGPFMAVILVPVNAATPDVPLYARPSVKIVLRLAAVLGVILGIETTILHLTTDPLADVRAYYDAGARLNAGLPLYIQAAGTNDPAFYRYPPLLAIAFRPLALLPYHVAAIIWESVVIGATLLTFKRLGLREPVLLVGAWLALPIMWTVSIGQAQALITFLLAVGSPWAVALAANIKLFPALAAIYWVGRREWRPLGRVRGLDGRPHRLPVRHRADGDDRLPRVHQPRAGRRGQQPVAVRDLAGALGGVGRRAHRHRAATRSDSLGLGGGGRPVGVRDPAAAELPALDAAGGHGRTGSPSRRAG